MKKENRVYCNLCQKSYADSDFINHVPINHLPRTKYVCFKCNAKYSSLQFLEDHLNSSHYSNVINIIKLQQYEFRLLFSNCNDIVQHINSNASDWIRNSFSLNFDNVLSKKKMRLLIKNSYRNTTNDAKDDYVCKLCCRYINNESVYCYYCGENFANKCHLKFHVITKHLQVPSFIKKLTKKCDTCDIFSCNKFFLKHKNQTHVPKINQNELYYVEKNSQFCHFCGKSLANKSNLKRHVLNQHSEIVGVVPNNSEFTCDYCKCFFSNKSSVKRHIENLHLQMKDTKKSISCFQCEQKFNSIKNLNAHLTIEHKISINEEKLHFKDLNEFWDWKQDEEIRTNSRFIQLRGLRRQRRNGEEISSLKFVCNRSGIFHSKSNGKRAYRLKGSSKIGRYCSAFIEIMFKDNISVSGTYCSTHSGHDNDLRYLTLTMDEKREIYEKIKNGATFATILNEIRNSVGKEIKRKHLVTNKDLHNIVTTFKKLSKSSLSLSPSSISNKCDLNADQVPILTTVENPQVSLTLIQKPADRNYNNDIDICADLWVDTCHRMINRFNDSLSRDTDEVVRIVPNINDNRTISTNDNHFLISNSEYSRLPTTYVEYPNSSVATSVNSANSSACHKSSQNIAVYNELQDEQLNDHLKCYTSNVATSRSFQMQRTIKNTTELCSKKNPQHQQNLYNIETGGEKEFYIQSDTSYDSSTTGNAETRLRNISTIRTVAAELKHPNIFPTNCYDAATSFAPSTNVDIYVRSINTCDKMSMPQQSSIHQSSYTYNDDKAMQSVAIAVPVSAYPEQSFEIPDKTVVDFSCDSESLSSSYCEDAISNVLATAKTHTVKNDNVSDLRDRVNSVTALYNIVENELDERKKNIIRNYVDNMFRVLQYRYNKCKTKKPSIKKDKKEKNPVKKGKSRTKLIRTDIENSVGIAAGQSAALEEAKSDKNKITKIMHHQTSLNQYLFSDSPLSGASVKTTVAVGKNSYVTNTNNTTFGINLRQEMDVSKWNQY